MENPYEAPQARVAHDEVEPSRIRLASPWLRLIAALIDIVLQVGLMVAFVLVGFAFGVDEESAVSVLFMLAGFLAYFVLQATLLTVDGTTVGKRLLGMRIVLPDGSQAGFARLVLLRTVLNGALGFVPFYSLIDPLFIFREDRRCLHDLIAGTIVVESAPKPRRRRNSELARKIPA